MAFALTCVHHFKRKIRIRIYDNRWKTDLSVVRFKTDIERNNPWGQVGMLQQEVIELLPQEVQLALIARYDSLWPSSRNIPIRESEDRLLDLIQTDAYKGMVKVVASNTYL
jgi:hypothetical protein